MRQSRLSQAIHPQQAPPILKRQPMSADEVRGCYLAALDEYNDYMERNSDLRQKYEREFSASAEMDPYERKNFLENLTLGKYPKHFKRAVVLLSKLYYWQEQAAAYRVDDAVVLAIQTDIPYWLQRLQGPDNPLHEHYEPVKGKVFLP